MVILLVSVGFRSVGLTLGKTRIEHVTDFLSKYISKSAIDIKFLPDVGKNPSNPHMQKGQTIDVHKLSYA